MTATLRAIQRWVIKAKKLDASHLIVAVDTYNHENFPVFVSHDENIKDEIDKVESQRLQGIDEVYNMSMDIDQQLSQHRAWNI